MQHNYQNSLAQKPAQAPAPLTPLPANASRQQNIGGKTVPEIPKL